MQPLGLFLHPYIPKGKMRDDQIIQGCIERDLKAQKMLYDRHARKMMGVCLRYCKTNDEAKDLLQESFIKVFEKISTYRAEGSLEAWVKKIVITTALEEIRRKKIDLVKLMPDEYLAEEDQIASDSKIQTKDLLNIIQQLPEGFKVIFNLYAIEGYTHPEIAEKLNITEGTSKSQYARARAYIQRLLVAEKI